MAEKLSLSSPETATNFLRISSLSHRGSTLSSSPLLPRAPPPPPGEPRSRKGTPRVSRQPALAPLEDDALGTAGAVVVVAAAAAALRLRGIRRTLWPGRSRAR